MYVNKTCEIFESKISNGRSLYVINVGTKAEYLYNKDPELGLKCNPKDDNIRKLYTFGIKIEADNYDNNFNHFSYGIAGLKWLKITIRTDLKSNYKKEDDNNREIWELSLKEACKEIIDKYKNNPLDIDFASFSTDKIEVTGNVSIIAASNSEVKKACDLKEYRYQGSIVYNKDKNIYYYVLNNSEQECAVILCPFIERAVLEQGKYIQLGFDAVDVANYMAGEIENNLKSTQAQDIKSILHQYESKSSLFIKNMLNSSNELIINYKDKNDDADIYFGKCVEPNSIWDHKWQLSALFPSMGLSRRYHHIYNNIDIFYDTWSNIHFGFIGTYVGYSQEKLLNGAGEAQKISDQHLIGKIIYLALGYRTNYVNGAKYDNDIDGHLICKGVELFLTKNSNITAHDLLNAVSNAYKRF